MTKGNRPKVAFIVQRCGLEVNGGAESHCLQMAQRMGVIWRTEVLTTCAHDYISWSDHFPEGEETCGDTLIRRFSVSKHRDIEKFNKLSENLHPKQRYCTLEEQEEWMSEQGPISSDLTEYISAHRDDYDLFIFFGYLYATTYYNLPIVADKAWLAPLAHDEWTINFAFFDKLFQLPQMLLFNTNSEERFLKERFFHLPLKGIVAGLGIETPSSTNPFHFKEKYGIENPFILYCGRIDPSKGCQALIDAFIHWKANSLIPHDLVLMGKPVMPLPEHPNIIKTGFVSDEDKWNGMSAAEWLIMPSEFESLSMVLLEAWSLKTPAIVNKRCEVLEDHITRGKGGVSYQNWDQVLNVILHTSQLNYNSYKTFGSQYVDLNYKWDRVIDLYSNTLKNRTTGNSYS